MRIGSATDSPRDPLVISNRLPYRSRSLAATARWHRGSRGRRRDLRPHTLGLRRTPPWRAAMRCPAARGCRSSGIAARGSSRARRPGFVRARVSPLRRGTQIAAVVPQGLAHQRELRLVLARHGNAGGVDLGETRVREGGAALVGAPDRVTLQTLRVGREIEDVAVARSRAPPRRPVRTHPGRSRGRAR